MTGQAQALVSGDRDILAVKTLPGDIPVLTVAEFKHWLEAQKYS